MNMVIAASSPEPCSSPPLPATDRQKDTANTRCLSQNVSSQDDSDKQFNEARPYKRRDEPLRNQEGNMICTHSECPGITFDRKCEWSKHMDKHDRPYKCLVKGCEKLQGFTYSGGLQRHEREVHKMYSGEILFCQFTACKRSVGTGFTRKENLKEHIRRLHTVKTTEHSPPGDSRQASQSPDICNMEYLDSEEPSLKRKQSSESLRVEVKRLRDEMKKKDERLWQLEQAVEALQQSRE